MPYTSPLSFAKGRQLSRHTSGSLDIMDLKFSFGASNPLPLSAEGAGSASAGGASSVLELHVTLVPEESLICCSGVSLDGVSYASASKQFSDENLATLAAAVRSVLARGGAELPEPLLTSVSSVALSLGGREADVLEALKLAVSPSSPVLAQVDEALQARTGIAAGTPIRVL